MKRLNIAFAIVLCLGAPQCELVNEAWKEYNQYVSREGLVAEYLFNGNADDTSGNGFHGTVSGATLTTDRFGRADRAYYFTEASSQYIDCGDDEGTQITGAITIAVWIKLNNLSDHEILGRGFANGGPGTGYGYAISYISASGLIYFCSGNSGTRDSRASTRTIADTNWHFITAVWDGSTFPYTKRIYIDGFPAGAYTAQISSISYDATWSRYLNIGRHPSGGAWTYFDGNIDDIRIYRRELSVEEIYLLYHEGGY
ncbi:MAG: LamG domain-containing protein [Spirochaetes bacterium]|nr:LamG domain-containing protein [Spirochaetota bacterium]